MKVIMKKTQQVKEVADGYAQNYLFPNGLAEPATGGAVNALSQQKAKEQKQKANQEAQWEAMKKDLEGATITLTEKANEDGTLFGAVNQAAVEKALKAEGKTVKSNWISMPDHVKAVGEYRVTITFPSKVKAQLTLVIEAA